MPKLPPDPHLNNAPSPPTPLSSCTPVANFMTVSLAPSAPQLTCDAVITANPVYDSPPLALNNGDEYSLVCSSVNQLTIIFTKCQYSMPNTNVTIVSC